MKRMVFCIALTVFSAFVAVASADEVEEDLPWKAGMASAVITPTSPLKMAGYAARKDPAEGTEQELHAKALAIEDAAGQRLVVLTMDLIGVIERLRTEVSLRCRETYGLPPQSLLMNASHTHCGPAYGRDEAQEYFDHVAETLVSLVGQALERLEPASLAYCSARCGFAMNRRTPSETGYRNHPNPHGPVDHTVPVLRITGADGQLRGVVFGYACHNTTMGFLKWLGDYAGYAQEYFQQDHPDVTALFLMGCSADQNPYPRSQLKYAQNHGRALATAVEAALEVGQRTPLHQRPVRGPLRCALETISLQAENPERADCAYPVQVVRFGNDLSVIALGNEVVVDYSLRLKTELGGSDGPAVWVAGYSNAYDGYIASKRVLEEGGYEARCCPWKDTLEEHIVGTVHKLYRSLDMVPE